MRIHLNESAHADQRAQSCSCIMYARDDKYFWENIVLVTYPRRGCGRLGFEAPGTQFNHPFPFITIQSDEFRNKSRNLLLIFLLMNITATGRF